MLNKTITKKIQFVISLVAISAIFSACPSASSNYKKSAGQTGKNLSADYGEPRIIAKIESNEVTESSGLVASKCGKDVFWTHNDSGDEAFIYAFNSRGEKLGTWKVGNAKNKDWEDMAAFKNSQGECFLYLGDIGNNDRLDNALTIYRIKEPKISETDKSSTKKNPSPTENAVVLNFTYPDTRHDAETLMVHPTTEDIYVLTKRVDGASGVYKIKPGFNSNRMIEAEKLADFTVPSVPNGLLTGGEISPDGNRVIVCDYFAAFEIVLPEKSKNFDDIWKEKPVTILLGERKQGEAVCYAADGKAIFATSEKKNSPLIEVKRKNQ